MPKGPRLRPAVEAGIVDLHRQHPKWSANQIMLALPEEHRPALRTVQTRVKQMRDREAALPGALKDDLWRWGTTLNGLPRASRALLDTWVFARQLGHGVPFIDPPGGLTQREATWVEQIHRIAPEMEPIDLLYYGHAYYARERAIDVLGRDLEFADLDNFLGYGPWRSQEAYTRYHDHVQNGYIPAMPTESWAQPHNDLQDAVWGVSKEKVEGNASGEDDTADVVISPEVERILDIYAHSTALTGLLPSQIRFWSFSIGLRMATGQPLPNPESQPWPGNLLHAAWEQATIDAKKADAEASGSIELLLRTQPPKGRTTP